MKAAAALGCPHRVVIAAKCGLAHDAVEEERIQRFKE